MADYRINISVDDKDSGRKVDELDKKLKEVTKPKKINIEFPNLSRVKQNLQEVSKYSGVAVQAFKQFTPIGRQFAELEDNVKVVGNGLANVGRTLAGMSAYANPVRGIADGFGAVSQSIDAAVRTTANLGFAIFGVTQSVNVLRAAFGQAFADTVGREVKLREQILQTATTLAGTNRIFAEGFEIKDPTQKLQVLEGSVNKSIERIRERSLEIAGTTSAAVIGVFNIVASQIGSFGGTMQQAEDLAVKFSGALGTLGMSDPGYARQEIGSIMMGNITTDSALAKTIGISNQDIQKARQQGKLYEYLTEKLAVFEAGQKIAAKGFAGITSNIQELQEELKRSFGASLLDPILKRIEAFYAKVSGKQVLKDLLDTARGFGQLIGSTLNTAFGTVANAPVFKGIDSKGISSAAKELETIFARLTVYIQEQFARIAPFVQGVVDKTVKSVAMLGKAFVEVGAAIARLKIDQLAIQLQAFSDLSNIIPLVVRAYGEYLKVVEQVISTPIGQYINELNATFKVLDRLGVIGFGQFVVAALAIKKVFPEIVAGVKGIATAIGDAFTAAAARVAAVMTTITGAVAKAVTTAITAVTVGVLRILALISTLAGRIEIALNAISTKLMLGGGILSKLAQPIYAVSQAFGQISAAAQRAEVAVADLGIKGTIAMQRLQTGAQGAAGQVNALGATLRGGVTEGAKTAAGAIAGFGLSIVKGIASMALWTVAITVVLDGLRRISEWWERMQQRQEFKQAIDSLNNGLLDQAEAAKKAGKALDEVTAARLRMAQTALTTEKDAATKDLDAAVKKYDEFQRYIEDRKKGNRVNPLLEAEYGNAYRLNITTPAVDNAKLLASVAEAKARLKEAQKAIDDFEKKNNPSATADPQLKQQENRQAIAELAKFEKDTRRAIEDEVYSYQRQAQDKELQAWRQQGELRIQRIASENQLMIDGVNSEARASLEALNNWLSSKRRGELDIEAKKREAQMAAADLERALGKFRLNLEQQVAELRKRVAQYEFDVLDKRIKAEQLIANIRNGSIVYEPPGGGQFRVGSTGRSTGPHLHMGGTDAEKVVEEALTIIKAWQKMGIEYIKLSNVKADVKNITDDNKLRHLIRQEMVVHGRRSGNNPVDIAVPPGTPLPVAHGPVTWGGAAEGYMARSTATGNFFLHGLKPEGGGGSAPAAGSSLASRQNAAMQFFMSKGLTRVQAAALVGGFMQESTGLDPSKVNPKSGAEGIAQWKGSRRDAMIQAGARNSFQKQLNFVWQELMAGENNAYVDLKNSKTLNQALLAAARYERFRGYQQLGGGEWGNRVAFTKQLLSSGAGSTGGAAGSASLSALGEMPKAPDVTLNIDTSPIEAAQGRLNTLNQDLIELGKNQNALNSEEGFRAFMKSLDTTSADLERINKQVRDQTIDLTAVTAATKGGIYDPETLQADIRYQQSLASLEAVRRTSLETLAKFGNITAEERARAEAGIGKAYEDNKKRLLESLKLDKQRLDIDKERQRLLDLNAARRQAQGDLKLESFKLQSDARSALLAPDDFSAQRYEQALQTIEAEFLRLTENDTKPLSDIVKDAFETWRQQILANAKSLAELDKVVNQNRRIREMENQVEQNRVERLSSEGAARTEAAKAALDPSNFQALRRLDVQQMIYGKYLELTKGETQPLTEDEAKQLQRLAEQALASADALAKVDTELQSFAERLALARDSARAITEGYKGMITSVMNGGSLSDAVSQMGQNVAARFTEKILDYSFKPMEKQLESMFGKLFGVDDAQVANTNALTSLTTKVQELITAITTAAAAPATPQLPEAVSPTPGTPPSGDPAAPTTEAATGKLAQGLGKNAKDINTATDQTLTGLQRYTTGLASVATAAMSMVGGIDLMRKGGTYNTLMGLASIFGSLGSFTGMFAKGGVFGARAGGGPIIARQPYLVGERGPELFLPESDGRVVSSSATNGMFQRTRAALASQRSAAAPAQSPSSVPRPSPIEVRYEAQVINNVEYVTAEQHRKGMQEAARRGQMLAYQGMQHSVKVRRRLGV